MSEPLPSVPARIAELHTLARNLRWSWHEPVRELFARIDADLWERTGQNPVRLLREVDADRLAELAADDAFAAAVEEAAAELRRYLDPSDGWWQRRHGEGADGAADLRVAYFSAEFAVANCLPIFSGGLGVLAGDHLKSASDLGVPLVGVGLLYREGYFRQELDPEGRQLARYERVDPELLPISPVHTPDGWPAVVRVPMGDRQVGARVWRADVGRVPLYLLDTDIDGNSPDDRRIADRLYGGDQEHRLKQEIVLGIGGMRALRAIGFRPTVIHLNEGHAAFAAVERARQVVGTGGGVVRAAAGPLARSVVFTTHTPVPAGHDHFPPDLLERYLGGYVWAMHEPWDAFLALGRRPNDAGIFCMTSLAMRTSGRRNGVSRLHGAVSRSMWAGLWPDRAVDDVPVGHVTNGVHLATWVAPESQALFEEYLGEAWRAEADDMHWHRAIHIPLERLWATRQAQRARLVERARQRLAAQVARAGGEPSWTARALDPGALTIVFARRFATYKRATLLLSQPERLRRLLAGPHPVQFVFAGKAHPRDLPGQEFLRQVAAFAADPAVRERFVFLEGYDVDVARDLVCGADVWLNVPRRPHEASGTSGMKAAANGALNLSIPDGWWAEAWTDHNRHADPIGWSIDPGAATARAGETYEPVAGNGHVMPVQHGPLQDDSPEAADRADADELFRLLEEEVVPLFYDRDESGIPVAWLRRVRASIRQIAPFFNTHRMVGEYTETLYLPAHRDRPAEPAGAGAGTPEAAAEPA